MAEKLLSMNNGLSIWKVGLDETREQDKNARVMDAYKFDILTENIKKDKRLESLPLVIKEENISGNTQFKIISGHHRIRAARSAEVKEIYVINIDEELSQDAITAKQLSHNSLNGKDDDQIMKELYLSIKDFNEKIASGIISEDIENIINIKIKDEISLGMDYEILNIMFFPNEKKLFDEAINNIMADKDVYVEDIKSFLPFKKAIQKIKKIENVRNIAGILKHMAKIVKEYYMTKNGEVGNGESG